MPKSTYTARKQKAPKGLCLFFAFVFVVHVTRIRAFEFVDPQKRVFDSVWVIQIVQLSVDAGDHVGLAVVSHVHFSFLQAAGPKPHFDLQVDDRKGGSDDILLVMEGDHLLIPAAHSRSEAFLDLLGCAFSLDFSAFVLELGHLSFLQGESLCDSILPL